MKKQSVLLAAAALAAIHSAHALVLQSVPMQGTMLHVNVKLTEPTPGSYLWEIHPEAGTPQMAPLAISNPGDSFASGDPWFDELDPSSEGRAFSRRWGFLLDLNSVDLPAGTSIGIRMTGSSPGLDSYFYRDTNTLEQFTPVFDSAGAHDYVLWSGVMWHPAFTAPAGTGNYSATFEVFLADAVGSGNVDYTTSAGTDPRGTSGSVTLGFTSIPEPAAASLVALALAASAACRRRR